MLKRLICGLLALALIFALSVPVFATEEETAPELPTTVLYITGTQSFLRFAEDCRMDSYSRGLRVELQCDIDLTGTDFSGIPIFCGNFQGNGYTISGLNITGEGSYAGLFRYLTDTATVQDLTVEGSVCPQGSGNYVGGIAGENAGVINACVFRGTVSGNSQVGAIAGRNRVSGIISGCRTEGLVHGDHFVGGIAGENLGVIRSCANRASVNITPQQNSVDLADITLESITSAESVNTVTDVGGIAGTSGGLIRDCYNFATIGYRQMGYNIGGIAGSQMGYIADCQNFASVSGRKEVGGIVGQMEPVTNIVYTTDVLQQLQQQLDIMGALAGNAASHAQSSASAITGQFSAIENNIETAKDAVNSLLSAGGIPDLDRLQATQNALSSSFRSMQTNLQDLSATAQTAANTISQDMQALMGQVGVMGTTLNDAQENLGGTITDISDLDTAEDATGKVARCVNSGEILADRNAGGITGAIAPENDLDPEEDVTVQGESSLDFDSQLRAVILDCENTAAVTVNKQYGGGIIGLMSMGLVKQSTNSGTLYGENADYIGGIAGRSFGFIRSSSANCILSGSTYVGGIAGFADVVTDCRSMVRLSATEKAGAVIGYAENRENISGNFYQTLETDPGAIDGISYEGCAQPLASEALLSPEELPAFFQYLNVTFVFEDGTKETVQVAPGASLTDDQIPALPEKEGYSAAWEGLDREITFDTTVSAVYTPYEQVMESDLLGQNQRPVLLAEGSFLPGETLSIQETELPALPEKHTAIGCAEVILPQSIVPITLHYLVPAETEVGAVWIRTGSAAWQEVAFHIDGSYVVLEAPQDTTAIAISQAPSLSPMVFIAAGAFLVVTVVVILLLKKKQKN